jgi:hypothetical protein
MWQYILILYSHLRLGLLSGLFLSAFSIKTSTMRATCPAQLILFYLVNRIIFGVHLTGIELFFYIRYMNTTCSDILRLGATTHFGTELRSLGYDPSAHPDL